MKDQLVMSPNNAEVAVAIPLYRMQHEETLGNLAGYSVSLTNEKPLMYILDCGPGVHACAYNAKWVEDNLIFLGDL